MMAGQPWDINPTPAVAQPKKEQKITTNQEFIDAIFRDKPDNARVVVTGFRESPGGGNPQKWASKSVFSALPPEIRADSNNYFGVSTVKAGIAGTYNRIKANFAACYVVMVDDIGFNGKVSEDSIRLPPSYIIETSPDNCQYGYILAIPCHDVNKIDALFRALVAKGLTDPNGLNPVRWARTPFGVNSKESVVDLYGEPFPTQLLKWEPSLRYTIDEIIEGLELDMPTQPQLGAGNLAGFNVLPQLDMAKASDEIKTGAALHDNIRDAAAHYIAKGLDPEEVVRILQDKMKASDALKDSRWLDRFNDIPRAVKTAVEKGYGPVAPTYREVVKREEINDEEQIPEHLLQIPGVLNDFIAFYKASAVTHQPHLAVQSALALGAVVCGRYMITDRKINFSNLWFLNVAKSGAGKEQGKWCIEEVLSKAGHHNLVAEGYTSKGGVFSALDDSPNHLTIIDEIGRYLDAGLKNKGNSHFKDAVTILMETWGRSHGTLRPPTHSTRSANTDIRERLSQPIIKPCISMLGMTTPSTLFDAIDESAVSDGFLARFIMGYSDIEAAHELTEDEFIDPPQSLIDWVSAVQAKHQPAGNIPVESLGNNPTLEPITRTVHITDEAWAIIQKCKKHEISLIKEYDSSNLSELVKRLSQKAIRIALIVSVSKDHIDPVITPDVMQWAVDYATYCDVDMVRKVMQHMTSGRLGKLIKQVSTYIEKGKEHGKTMRELLRSYGGHGKDLDDALKLIKGAGIADLIEVQHLSGRGRKRVAWVSEKYLKNIDEYDD